MNVSNNETYCLESNERKAMKFHFGGTYITQYMVTFAASVTMLILGLIVGWTGPNLLILRSNKSPIPITDDEMAWLPSSTSIGIFFISFFTIYFTDTFGRRKTLLISIIPSLLSFIFVYFATNIWVLYISRFFAGVSVGIVSVALPTYITEISSPEIRGKLGMYTGILIPVGTLIENFLVPYTSFYTSALICSVLCVVFGFIVWFIPVSPYFSLMCNNETMAEKTLKFLRQKEDTTIEFDQLKTGWALEQKEGKCNITDLIKTKHVRYCLWIVLGATLVVQLSGALPVIIFQQVTLKRADPPISVSTCALILSILSPVFHLVTAPFVDIWGRRMIFIIATLLAALSLTINGIFFSLQSANYIHISSITLMPFFGYLIFHFAVSCGLVSICRIYTGELFAIKLRAKAGAVVMIFASALELCVINSYEKIEENFGTEYCFYTFATFSLIGTVFGLVFLPETKMKSLEKIQLDLRKNNFDEQN